MVIGITKQYIGDHQALDVGTHRELLGHAPATVHLDTLATNPAAGPAHHHLQGQQATAKILIAGIQRTNSAVEQGLGIFTISEHVHHTVLQRLERSDVRTKLLAGLEVFQGLGVQGFHGTQGIGCHGENGPIQHRLQ